MKLIHLFLQPWKLPPPDKVRGRLLHEARLELMAAQGAAEDHAVKVAQFSAHADMLRDRIHRLEESNA